MKPTGSHSTNTLNVLIRGSFVASLTIFVPSATEIGYVVPNIHEDRKARNLFKHGMSTNVVI